MRLLALHKRIVDVFEIFIRMLLASYVNRQKRAEQSRADSSRVLERERERETFIQSMAATEEAEASQTL